MKVEIFKSEKKVLRAKVTELEHKLSAGFRLPFCMYRGSVSVCWEPTTQRKTPGLHVLHSMLTRQVIDASGKSLSQT